MAQTVSMWEQRLVRFFSVVSEPSAPRNLAHLGCTTGCSQQWSALRACFDQAMEKGEDKSSACWELLYAYQTCHVGAQRQKYM